MKSWFRWIGFSIGILLFALLARQVQWSLVLETLGLLKSGYLLVFTYPIVWIVFNTLGTRASFTPENERIPFFKLLRMRLAGETFNALLPSGYIGGEPLKAKLFSNYMSLRDATSAVLIAKAAQSVALIVFVSIGFCLPKTHVPFFENQKLPLIALCILSGGVLVFVILLTNQAFTKAGHLLYNWTRWSLLPETIGALKSLDERLGDFYKNHKRRLAASVLWHACGWLAGSMELAVICYLLGKPLHWRDAWFMGALAQLAAIMGLIAPAGIGFFESGHAMAAVILGLPPSFGLSLSLIRRVREGVWDLIGLGIYWKESTTPPKI